MQHRYEVQSLPGLVQQLASNVLSRGYYFYVTGQVKEGKDPKEVDRKLIDKYRVNVSASTRARQRERGKASVHYLRLGRTWWLLATHGQHCLKREETKNLRDVREIPLRIGGYSLYVRRGEYLRKASAEEAPRPDGRYHTRVLIDREQYAELRARFLSLAAHRSPEKLVAEFWRIPFEPYAPIRKQLLKLLRLVNKRRQAAGYEKIPVTVLRLKRQIWKVFAE
jgi:hypothetical protein